MSQAKFSQIEVRQYLINQRCKTAFNIKQFCFDKQIAFIEDPARFKTAVCSRRAGKTIACAAHLVSEALANPKRVCFYITLSRANAKRIIWPEVLEINRTFKLAGVVNETDLSIKFPNGSIVYFSGANDRSEIEKFRGFAITLCYLDECQSFPYYIRNLIEDVISKALFDYNGVLCLIGTPGSIPVGYFYDCATSKDWSHHAWNMFDNPWLEKKAGKSPQEILGEELKRKGVDQNDPTIQRECFGRWVVDTNSLLFRYSADCNDYGQRPIIGNGWDYILGIDVGHDDADAIATIGFHPAIKESYLVEEIITKKQGVTELADQIEYLIKKYEPLKIVMDTGGLGKKIASEINRRRAIPIEAAEKSRKMEYIELLNDALRTGRFKAKKESSFATDCSLIEIDRDKTTPEKIVVSDRYHSDIADAVLYAFRESLHWLHQETKVMAAPYTPQWYLDQEQQMEQELIERIEKEKQDFMIGGLNEY